MTPNEEADFENWFGDITGRLIYRDDPILRHWFFGLMVFTIG